MFAVFLLLVYSCLHFAVLQVSGDWITVTNKIDHNSYSPSWSGSFVININENLKNQDGIKTIVAEIVRQFAAKILPDSLTSTSRNHDRFEKFFIKYGELLTYDDLFGYPTPSRDELVAKFNEAGDYAFERSPENLVRDLLLKKVTSKELIGLLNGDLRISYWDKCRQSANEVLASNPILRSFIEEFIKDLDRLQGGSVMTNNYIKEFLKKLRQLH